MSERQQLLRVDYESAEPRSAAVESRVFRKFETLLGCCDAVIVEDYAKGLLEPDAFARDLQSRAPGEASIAAADPNPKTPAECYRGAWVLTPNTREAEHLSGFRIRDEPTLARSGTRDSQVLARRARRDHARKRGDGDLLRAHAGERS